jgi:hypothetical protein
MRSGDRSRHEQLERSRALRERAVRRTRDPDGYLIEVGQSTGLLEGHLAQATG